MSIIDDLVRRINALENIVERLSTIEQYPGAKFFALPLTSTDWDGDAHSTTAKTLIDLSIFTNAASETVPTDARAVLVRLAARDSASSTTSCFIAIAPNSTADIFALVCKPYDRPNDDYLHVSGVVPCDANGDIYFQCTATGANTLDVILEIWGYWK